MRIRARGARDVTKASTHHGQMDNPLTKLEVSAICIIIIICENNERLCKDIIIVTYPKLPKILKQIW